MNGKQGTCQASPSHSIVSIAYRGGQAMARIRRSQRVAEVDSGSMPDWLRFLRLRMFCLGRRPGAEADGAITVTNARTGFTKTYKK